MDAANAALRTSTPRTRKASRRLQPGPSRYRIDPNLKIYIQAGDNLMRKVAVLSVLAGLALGVAQAQTGGTITGEVKIKAARWFPTQP